MALPLDSANPRLPLWRWLGAAGGILTLVGTSLVIFFVSQQGAGWTASSYLVFLGLKAMAVVAVWASLTGRPGWLLLAFGVSFFPVGLYLSGAPGPARWIGAAIALYLVAALGMLVDGRRGAP